MGGKRQKLGKVSSGVAVGGGAQSHLLPCPENAAALTGLKGETEILCS